MANLSDLATVDIGIIAFWNALDHWIGPGANEIDPTQCAGVFDSVNYYDNGIEGYKALGSGRYFHARVKSDGWMVAWIDRTNTFSYPTKPASEFGELARKGYYDILKDWLTYTTNISTTQTTLSYLISLLYNALTNKVDFNYANADVGHYCYEYLDADVLTLTSKDGSADDWEYGQIRYTTGATLYYAACTASAYGHAVTPARVKFEGNMLVDWQAESARYGVADIKGWMPNPLTDYELGVYRGILVGYSCKALGAILVIWK